MTLPIQPFLRLRHLENPNSVNDIQTPVGVEIASSISPSSSPISFDEERVALDEGMGVLVSTMALVLFIGTAHAFIYFRRHSGRILVADFEPEPSKSSSS